MKDEQIIEAISTAGPYAQQMFHEWIVYKYIVLICNNVVIGIAFIGLFAALRLLIKKQGD